MYRIKDWAKHFENNRTRELVRMAWVPMPNKMDGDGYTELVSHENGAAHLGAWCAIVEIASRCDPRGTLVRSGGIPHNYDSLARVSRLPSSIFIEVIPRLISIGWIELLVEKEQQVKSIPQDGATIPQEGASTRVRAERNGTERNGTEEKIEAAPPVGEKSREGKPAKVPSGDHQRLIAHWCAKWEARYGRKFPYAVASGRNSKEIKTLLDSLGYDDAAAAMDRYLASRDEFVNGHPLGLLMSQLPKYVVQTPAEQKAQSIPFFREDN